MVAVQQLTTAIDEIAIRPLEEGDLEVADRVMRIAFGTFLGAPDPVAVFGDADYVRSRFLADPGRAFVAELDGEVVGSNFATRWGSYGFFGPLTVRVDLWDRGIGGRLMQPIMNLFAGWGVQHAGLFTFPHSPKHIGLYQKFGFWPQHLTPVLGKPVVPAKEQTVITYSAIPEDERSDVLAGCRAVTDAIYPGLDLESEIRAADEQGLGDTVLIGDDRIDGFAVCHIGAGEAGSGSCYTKFGAVRPGPDAGERFERLIDACEAVASDRGAGQLMGGVNMARHDAYRRLLARGYQAGMIGVIMQRPNDPGFCRPDAYVIDDLR